MIRVWDTQACIEGIKHHKRKFIESFLNKDIVISCPTITELNIWESNIKEVDNFFNELHRLGYAIVPKRKDYLRAGKWVKQIRFQGTPKEIQSKRVSMIMDALIASSAWSQGYSVVTDNAKDFKAIIKNALGFLPSGTNPPEIVSVKDALKEI